MDGYEPPLADPADFVVPRNFRMLAAHGHWWDPADKTGTWGVSSRNWQHQRLMWSWRLDQERFSAPEYRAEASGLGVIKVVHVQHATMATLAPPDRAQFTAAANAYNWHTPTKHR